MTKAIAQDGLALWKQLIQKFYRDPDKTTASDTIQLKDSYTSMSGEANQTLTSFALSYHNMEKKLARHNASRCIPIKFITSKTPSFAAHKLCSK